MIKYDKYKDSGVEWLGSVPEQWEVKRVKDIFNLTRGKFTHRPRNDEKMYLNGTFPFIQTGDVARSTKFVNTFKQTLNENGIKVSRKFKKGTIVMTIAANIGDVAVLGFDAYFPDSLVAFLTKQNIDYFFYLLAITKSELDTIKITNTQDNLNLERLNGIFKVVPPLSEQTAIATYLDSKTSAIDRKVSLLEQKTTHYQQLRKSLINETVCRGLDKNAKLKDSGIEWIREIPEHWEVKRMKDYFQISKRVVGKLSSNFRLLSLTQNGIIFRDLDKNAGKFPAEFDTYQIVNSNDLIFCLFDLDVTPRTVGYSEINGMITGAYTIISSNESKSFNKYYYYLYLMIDSSKNLSLFYTGLRNTIKKDTLPYESFQKINFKKCIVYIIN